MSSKSEDQRWYFEVYCEKCKKTFRFLGRCWSGHVTCPGCKEEIPCEKEKSQAPDSEFG